MAGDDREKNFRSAYYNSLGFRENEKALMLLESLLKSEVIEVDKLTAFSLKHSLPIFYRGLVWKLMLGVEPVHRDEETQGFVMKQHRHQFEDLKHALHVLGRSHFLSGLSSYSPINIGSPHEDFASMFFIEAEKIGSTVPEIWSNLSVIAKAFQNTYKDEAEAYSTFSRFSRTWERVMKHRESMVTEFGRALSNTDSELSSHILSLSAFSSLPFHLWFDQCFISILSPMDLECLLDRVIAGSWMLLVSMAVAALLLHKQQLLVIRRPQQISDLLEQSLEEKSTSLLQKGIFLWECNGSSLLPPSLVA